MNNINKYLIGLRKIKYIKDNKKYKVGDVLVINYENLSGYWKTKIFTGICIAIKKRGINLYYTLRNVIKGESIELSFYYYNPIILQIEQLPVQKIVKLRKSKLWFLRLQNKQKSTVNS